MKITNLFKKKPELTITVFFKKSNGATKAKRVEARKLSAKLSIFEIPTDYGIVRVEVES